MSVPAKVFYVSIDEYRIHFERVYCRAPILTFDNIAVRFRRSDFDHCMFESSNRDGNKDAFSKDRSERIDWIKATLQHPQAELYEGWDSKRKCYDHTRRLAVVYENFVVIIALTDDKKARFVTCYFADNSIEKIRKGKRWNG